MDEQSCRSAGTLLAQLVSKGTTSVALMNRYLSCTAQFNKPLGTVVRQYYALALEAAARADHERLKGRARGVLYGLSYTIKESSSVQGWLTTSGAHYLRDNRATQNAPSVAHLRAAGAILMGETNVPVMIAGWQTYNDLYGITHNLWDRQCSPGGSSGGTAAAVAADFTPVEFGSDLFGSLRIPAHYTGAYAHRRSLGLMPVREYMPGGGSQATDELDLLTAGPTMRSAAGLCLTMRALSTFWVEPPRIPDFSCYQAKANYRACTQFSASHHGVDQQIAQRFQSFTDKLRVQPSVEANDVMPADIDPDALFDIAIKLSGRLVSTALNGRQRFTAGLAALGFRPVGKLMDIPEGIVSHYQGMLKDSGEQRNADKLRHEYSRVMETLFARYDVLLIPVSPMLAFIYMQQPARKRKLIINGESQDYSEHLFQNMLAVVFGLPVAVHPLAKTTGEFPCGIQITSGYFHGDVAINFAEFCEGIGGGFTVPEGYQRRISVTAPIKTWHI